MVSENRIQRAVRTGFVRRLRVARRSVDTYRESSGLEILVRVAASRDKRGSAAILAGLLALIRPDPRVFLTTLAVLTCALLVLRLGFAAVFGDASVIEPTLPEAVKSSIEPDSVASAIVALVFLLLGMTGLLAFQTTVGFALGPISFPAYLLALTLTCFFVGGAVARRAAGQSRLQVSLGAVVGCALPLAYGSFRFDSIMLAVISAAVLLPVACLAARTGATRATRDFCGKTGVEARTGKRLRSPSG